MDEYFEILENAYKAEYALKKSKAYRLSIKLLNFYHSIKYGFFIENLKREIRWRKISKYSSKSIVSDFKYGSYPDESLKILVYTCVTNGYDNPLPPVFSIPNVDYVLYTDNQDVRVDGWQILQIPQEIKKLEKGTLINRYFKMHPPKNGKDYDYSIYIDGNIQVRSNIRNIINAISPKTGLAIHRHGSRNCIYDEVEACRILKKGNISNLKKQIEKYQKEGMPAKFGLYECTIIVCNLHHINAQELLHKWWCEFVESESLRDQISLPYIIWKNGYSIDDIGNLGYNLVNNPKFKYVLHSNKDKRFVSLTTN